MASFREHRGRWQARVRRKGSSALTQTFATLKDAKEWARLQEHKIDRGELGPDRKELERITLSKLVERYRDEVAPNKRSGDNEIIVLNAFLRHPICKKRLSTLSTADFATYRDERLKEIEAQSLQRSLSPIRNMFKVAQTEWGIPIRANPLSGLTLKAKDNKRERRLQDGEYGRLIEALAKTRNPLISPIIRLALTTAMRRGEILALRMKDIDLARQTLIIREAKNGHSRVIPLVPEAVAALSEAVAYQEKRLLQQPASAGLRFHKGRSRPVEAVERTGNSDRLFSITPMAVKLAFARVTKRAGLEDFHFHDLRHEAISRLFELGLTVPEVASISGHRTLSQLMRYAHAQHTSVRFKLGIRAA